MDTHGTSHIHCGNHENFDRVRYALLALQVDRIRFAIQELTIYVEVPTGVNPDDHQDALTSLANAVTA